MQELKQKHNYKAFRYRVTDAYIYLMLFLFPLFTGFEGYANVTRSKFLFLAAATVLWLFLLTIGKTRYHNKKRVGKPFFIDVLVLLYFIFCCVSAMASRYKGATLLGAGRFDGMLTTVLCLLIFIEISKNAQPKRSYFYASAAAVSVNCFVAVFQILGYNPLRLFPGSLNFYDAGVKFSSTFLGTIGNADLFSAYICLMLPVMSVFYVMAPKRPLMLMPMILLSAYCLFACGVSGGLMALLITLLIAVPFIVTSGESLRRALEIVLLLAAAAFLALTVHASGNSSGVVVRFAFSKVAVACAFVAVVLLVLRFIFSKSEFSKNRLRVFFVSLSILTVFCGLAAIYFWRGTEGTLYELSQVLHGSMDDRFGSSRILIWRKTLDLVPERLLLGGGPGTLALRLHIDFTRYVAETGHTLSTMVDNAHNDYLAILVNTGLLSLLAYLAAQLISLISAAKKSGFNLFSSCLICGLLCYWVQAFFGLGLFLVSPLMWLFWGLLIPALNQTENKDMYEGKTAED